MRGDEDDVDIVDVALRPRITIWKTKLVQELEESLRDWGASEFDIEGAGLLSRD